MCNGHNELDMSGTLTANLLLRHLYTTTVADDTLVADALVLTAMALVVLRRTKDALAEKTIALGLVGTIVDGFGFQNFTIGIALDFLGRGQTNSNLGEVILYLVVFLESHIVIV